MSRNAEHLDSETLSALIDEQGTAAARAVAVRHLASCAECTARKAAFESAAKAVGGLAKVGPTADETGAIRQAVLDARPGRPAWWPAAVHAGRRRLLAAGTAVAVVLGGAIWFGVASGGPTASSSAAKAPGHVAQSPQQPSAAEPLTVPAVNGAANPVPSAPGLAADASPFISRGSESTGGTLYVPPTPVSFSSEAQVASYVGGQATVRDEA
ncbi:MAG TPA: hypothetical protein VKY26_01830, partial [Actinomycetota bacterium]|nr:hypothetical protein [Actinomycetota bacterium]